MLLKTEGSRIFQITQMLRCGAKRMKFKQGLKIIFMHTDVWKPDFRILEYQWFRNPDLRYIQCQYNSVSFYFSIKFVYILNLWLPISFLLCCILPPLRYLFYKVENMSIFSVSLLWILFFTRLWPGVLLLACLVQL